MCVLLLLDFLGSGEGVVASSRKSEDEASDGAGEMGEGGAGRLVLFLDVDVAEEEASRLILSLCRWHSEWRRCKDGNQQRQVAQSSLI